MTPTCIKCGKPHYNFKKCETGPEKPVHVVRLPLPEGTRVWGDKISTARQGESRFMSRDTRPAHIGRVTYPDGEGPKAA